MDKRITDLTQIQFSAITANDVLPIVNISTDDTNKITIDQIKNYVNSGVTDTYVTGGTYFTGGTIIFDYNTGSNFEVSGLTEDLNNEIAGLAETDEQTITLNLDTNKIELKEIVAETTGGTRTFQGNFAISGGTLNLTTIGSGSPVINLGLDSSGEVVTGTTSFTGNTSGECISDIYVSNVHSCSPLHINPNDEGNVYFGSTSGVTVDLTNHKLVVENLQITSGATDGYILTSDASGNIELTAPTDGFTYQIGQYVEEEGGVIFHSYKDGVNENYLVVSIDDQAGSGLDCDTISVTYQLVGEEPVTVEVDKTGTFNGKNIYNITTAEYQLIIKWESGDIPPYWLVIYTDLATETEYFLTLSEDTPCPFGVFTIEEGSPFEAFSVAPVLSVWSNITNQLAGADSTWNGLENSLTITGQTGHTESAAQLCLEYGEGCDNILVTYTLVGEEPVTVEVDVFDITNGRNRYNLIIEGLIFQLWWNTTFWSLLFEEDGSDEECVILNEDIVCPFGTYEVTNYGTSGVIFEAFSVAPVNPKNDWYLPAIEELSLLWQNRFNVNRTLSGNSSFGTILGATQIGYNNYWCSTENGDNFAWYFRRNGDSFPGGNKSDTNYVRAVRKFSI